MRRFLLLVVLGSSLAFGACAKDKKGKDATGGPTSTPTDPDSAPASEPAPEPTPQ
jgi:hypothetical protein